MLSFELKKKRKKILLFHHATALHFIFLSTLLTDWIFGPKPVEEDPEGGSAEIEEEQRSSISSKLTETEDGQGTEKEKYVLLPGFHQGDGGCRHPSTTPPLRSAITSSFCGEKRISTHSVTFACSVAPYATSL